jgi:hypothetical protein
MAGQLYEGGRARVQRPQGRAIGPMIEESGFEIVEMKTGYMTGPKRMTFMYEGSAC